MARNAAPPKRGVALLGQFMGAAQRQCLIEGLRGEEAGFFRDKAKELHGIIDRMPSTGETEEQGDDAMVWLHYFVGGADWFITEKDLCAEQHQAFGWADLFCDGGELGYINIVELLEAGAELDFYWTPRTLADVKRDRGIMPAPEIPETEAAAVAESSAAE